MRLSGIGYISTKKVLAGRILHINAAVIRFFISTLSNKCQSNISGKYINAGRQHP